MKHISVILLILCVLPYLFIIPMMGCAYSGNGDCSTLSLKIILFRIIMSKIMGGVFILAGIMICLIIPQGFTVLTVIPKKFNILIIPSVKDRPPQFSYCSLCALQALSRDKREISHRFSLQQDNARRFEYLIF